MHSIGSLQSFSNRSPTACDCTDHCSLEWRRKRITSCKRFPCLVFITFRKGACPVEYRWAIPVIFPLTSVCLLYVRLCFYLFLRDFCFYSSCAIRQAHAVQYRGKNSRFTLSDGDGSIFIFSRVRVVCVASSVGIKPYNSVFLCMCLIKPPICYSLLSLCDVSTKSVFSVSLCFHVLMFLRFRLCFTFATGRVRGPSSLARKLSFRKVRDVAHRVNYLHRLVLYPDMTGKVFLHVPSCAPSLFSYSYCHVEYRKIRVYYIGFVEPNEANEF